VTYPFVASSSESVFAELREAAAIEKHGSVAPIRLEKSAGETRIAARP
jgi:hypothetical protein